MDLDDYANYRPPYNRSFHRSPETDSLVQGALNDIIIIQSGETPPYRGDETDLACRYLGVKYEDLPLKK
jgi:hypothetical protein